MYLGYFKEFVCFITYAIRHPNPCVAVTFYGYSRYIVVTTTMWTYCAVINRASWTKLPKFRCHTVVSALITWTWPILPDTTWVTWHVNIEAFYVVRARFRPQQAHRQMQNYWWIILQQFWKCLPLIRRRPDEFFTIIWHWEATFCVVYRYPLM